MICFYFTYCHFHILFKWTLRITTHQCEPVFCGDGNWFYVDRHSMFSYRLWFRAQMAKLINRAWGWIQIFATIFLLRQIFIRDEATFDFELFLFSFQVHVWAIASVCNQWTKKIWYYFKYRQIQLSCTKDKMVVCTKDKIIYL